MHMARPISRASPRVQSRATAARAGSRSSSTGSSVEQQQHGQGQWSSSSTGRVSGAAAARAGSVEQQQYGQGQRSSSSTGRNHRRQGRSSRTGAWAGEKEQHGCAGVGD
ncbi:hypothetical protein VPH35_029725 [Triticum aestivum]